LPANFKAAVKEFSNFRRLLERATTLESHEVSQGAAARWTALCANAQMNRSLSRVLASQPLAGKLVVAFEQAVSAPYCTGRLADAGARVIKVERPGKGDFARGYDSAAGPGFSAFFCWLNRGKESIECDVKTPEGSALMHRILSKADIFVQNLAPGAAERAGFGSEALRKVNPKLITCGISGYGEVRGGDYARSNESRQTCVLNAALLSRRLSLRWSCFSPPLAMGTSILFRTVLTRT
jgi:hypothetical protein